MTKGVANQSLLNTWPSGQMKVRLKPTGGAAVRSGQRGSVVKFLVIISTFGPKADIGHINFALNGETLQQVGGEEVDKGGVFGLIIDLEIPPILVTLDPELSIRQTPN